ncbi:MAG TPA: mechanosensitive ion channel family protein [Polyangiaceae bacterium]|nr:mechanosensitive ion channel family protein [Polyangiaceae bacterium]
MSDTTTASNSAIQATSGREVPRQLRALVEWVLASDAREVAWAVALTVVGFLAGRLVASLAVRALARAVARTAWRFDDPVIESLSAPLRWTVPLLIVRALVPLFSLSDAVIAWISHALLVALILCLGWIAVRFLQLGEKYIAVHYRLDADGALEARSVLTKVRVLKNIAHFGIAVVTIAGALLTFESVRSLGAGLLASTGVVGVILGFAGQKSIATLISGIHIAIAEPIRVDDVVVVEGEWGRIEEITLTYVVIRIWDLRRLVVPVNYFLEKPFQNWTRVSTDLLGAAPLHVDYSAPLTELRAEFDRIVEASPLWDRQTKVLQVTDATDSTLVVRPLMSAKNASDAWDLRCEVREKLIQFLQQHHPHALPRRRAEIVASTPEAAAAQAPPAVIVSP